MKEREDTICGVVVGRSGCGKTTFLRQYARKYVDRNPKMKVWFMDAYGKEEPYERIEYFNSISDDFDTDKYVNGLLILDETRITFNDFHSKELEKLLAVRRNRNLDVFLVYHSFVQTHKRYNSHFNRYCIFHQRDGYASVKNRLPYQIDKEMYERTLKYEKGQYLYVITEPFSAKFCKTTPPKK